MTVPGCRSPTSRSEGLFSVALVVFVLFVVFSSQAPYKLSGVSGSYAALKTLWHYGPWIHPRVTCGVT